MPSLTLQARISLAVLLLCWGSVAVADNADPAPCGRQRGPMARTPQMLRSLLDVGIVAQAYGAEADRLLLRGFDGSQGQSVAMYLDGMPLNLSGHVRDHGYAWPQLVIPELVATVYVAPGSHDEEIAQFGSAGAVHIETCDSAPQGTTWIAGSIGAALGHQSITHRWRRFTHRAVGVVGADIGGGRFLASTELSIDDGPFVHPSRQRRGTLWTTYRRPLGPGKINLLAGLANVRWADSGLVPQTQVDRGVLTAFSSVDPTSGGEIARVAFALGYRAALSGERALDVRLYFQQADDHFFRNESLYFFDPEYGDGREQLGHHDVLGLTVRLRRPLGKRWWIHLGTDGEDATIDSQVWAAQRRVRLPNCGAAANPCLFVNLRTRRLGAYARLDVSPHRVLKVRASFRGDQYTWDADDLDEETALTTATLTGNSAKAGLSMRAEFEWQPTTATRVLGRVARSHLTAPPVAAVDRQAYRALTPLWSYDLAYRVRPSDELEGTLTLWHNRHDAALVWDERTGAALAQPNRRYGLDASVRFVPKNSRGELAAHLGVARRTAKSDPRGPRAIGGLSARVTWRGGHAAARLNAISSRVLAYGQGSEPLIAATPTSVIDCEVRQSWGRFDATLTVENLTDTEWYEEQQALSYRATQQSNDVFGRMAAPGSPRTFYVAVAASF